MAFSRQFKALVRMGTFFGATWGVIGTFVSMVAGGPFVPSLLTYGAMFGVVGAMSGIGTAVLVARGESGKELGDIPVWRVASWGFLGGFLPGALISLLALAVGASDVVVGLLSVGLFSGGVGGALSASAAAAAKRVGSGDSREQPELPAT